jgi:hypothetical protein
MAPIPSLYKIISECPVPFAGTFWRRQRRVAAHERRWYAEPVRMLEKDYRRESWPAECGEGRFGCRQSTRNDRDGLSAGRRPAAPGKGRVRREDEITTLCFTCSKGTETTVAQLAPFGAQFSNTPLIER